MFDLCFLEDLFHTSVILAIFINLWILVYKFPNIAFLHFQFHADAGLKTYISIFDLQAVVCTSLFH
jgi:hypothetical protein